MLSPQLDSDSHAQHEHGKADARESAPNGRHGRKSRSAAATAEGGAERNARSSGKHRGATREDRTLKAQRRKDDRRLNPEEHKASTTSRGSAAVADGSAAPGTSPRARADRREKRHTGAPASNEKKPLAHRNGQTRSDRENGRGRGKKSDKNDVETKSRTRNSGDRDKLHDKDRSGGPDSASKEAGGARPRQRSTERRQPQPQDKSTTSDPGLSNLDILMRDGNILIQQHAEEKMKRAEFSEVQLRERKPISFDLSLVDWSGILPASQSPSLRSLASFDKKPTSSASSIGSGSLHRSERLRKYSIDQRIEPIKEGEQKIFLSKRHSVGGTAGNVEKSLHAKTDGASLRVKPPQSQLRARQTSSRRHSMNASADSSLPQSSSTIAATASGRTASSATTKSSRLHKDRNARAVDGERRSRRSRRRASIDNSQATTTETSKRREGRSHLTAKADARPPSNRTGKQHVHPAGPTTADTAASSISTAAAASSTSLGIRRAAPQRTASGLKRLERQQSSDGKSLTGGPRSDHQGSVPHINLQKHGSFKW